MVAQTKAGNVADDLSNALAQARAKTEDSEKIRILETAIMKARQRILEIQQALRQYV